VLERVCDLAASPNGRLFAVACDEGAASRISSTMSTLRPHGAEAYRKGSFYRCSGLPLG
jgi:hypothetical protein